MSNVYSKWLLVSDIDGTLNNKKRRLPGNNKVAIEEFVHKGGNFTLCSGRNLQSLSPHYKNLNLKTPAICMNGAIIYDFCRDSVVRYSTISKDGEEILLNLCKQFKSIQLAVFDLSKIYSYGLINFYGLCVSLLDGLSHKICPTVDSLPKDGWGKVTIFGFPSVCKKVYSVLTNEKNAEIFDCFFTSPFTIDIAAKGVNKGSAVKYLAEYLGVNSNNVAAIGDYFNDEAMLKSVSHPVCCGQAPDEIKKLCEYVTCHCNDGAVNDFINYIEKNYIL